MSTGRRGTTFWPTSHQELLLDAALGDASRAAEAWRVVRRTLDIDTLEDGSYSLLPLLYRRLNEVGIDDPVLPRLKGIYRHTWSRNQLLVDGLLSVVQALRGVGIDSVVTGAAAAAIRYYPEIGLRAVSELDVLVSRDAASPAFDVLERAGWRSARAHAGSVSLEHVASFVNTGGLTCFVHRDVLQPSPGLVEVAIRDVQIRVCDATDQLSQTLLFGARGHRLRNIQWLIDAWMILRYAGAEIDWERLFREAQERSAVTPVRKAVTYLQSRLEAPIPSLGATQLQLVPVSRRDALAYNVGAFGGPILGELPGTIADHIRRTANDGLARSMLSLPRSLQRAWWLEHMWQLPLVLVVKMLRRTLFAAKRERAARASRGERTSGR